MNAAPVAGKYNAFNDIQTNSFLKDMMLRFDDNVRAMAKGHEYTSHTC